MGATVDRDTLVERCLAARGEGLPAVADALQQAVADGIRLGDPSVAYEEWFRTSDLLVQRFFWPPGFAVEPHDHGGIWAAVVVVDGAEENRWFREDGAHVAEVGARVYEAGGVAAMGGEVIHGVRNPLRAWTAAIHVYGGDLSCSPAPRREWLGEPPTVQPFDVPRAHGRFARAVTAAGRRPFA